MMIVVRQAGRVGTDRVDEPCVKVTTQAGRRHAKQYCGTG